MLRRFHENIWKIFSLGKYSARQTGRLFHACAVVHNFVIDYGMDVDQYEQEVEDVNEGALDTRVRSEDTGEEGCVEAEKTEGARLRAILINKAQHNSALVVGKSSRKRRRQ
jgi:hypothetical protein